MEEKLLKVFEVANTLNEKQDNVYVQITYDANDNKNLEIAIRSKKDFSYVERCEMQLKGNYDMKCNNIINVLESYIQEVNLMNKKQAIAYAQIALETMLRSDYKNKVNIHQIK